MGFLVKHSQIDQFAEYLQLVNKDSGDIVCVMLDKDIDDDDRQAIKGLKYDETIVDTMGVSKYLPTEGIYFVDDVIDGEQASNFQIIEGFAIDSSRFVSYLGMPF